MVNGLLVGLFSLSVLLLVEMSAARVTHFVDRYGAHHRTAGSQYGAYFALFHCPRPGFYRHPAAGCQHFYRCVQFDQRLPVFTVFEFLCPSGLVFDERYEVCNWPSTAPSCPGSSEIRPTAHFRCPAQGYFRDPNNCRWFYKCVELDKDSGQLTAFEFKCPHDLVFDQNKLICNWKWSSAPCHTQQHPVVRMANPFSNNSQSVTTTTTPVEMAIDKFSSTLNNFQTKGDASSQPPSDTREDEEQGSYNRPYTSGLHSQRPMEEIIHYNAPQQPQWTKSYQPIGHPAFNWFQRPVYVVYPHQPSVHQLSTTTTGSSSVPPPPPTDEFQLLPPTHWSSRPHYTVQPQVPSIHVSYYSPAEPRLPHPPQRGYGQKSGGQYVAGAVVQPPQQFHPLQPSSNRSQPFGSRVGEETTKAGGGGGGGGGESVWCERAGLFRHPTDCNRFYECYWDRWLNRFTVHLFRCPVRLVYDDTISGCNWPVMGPTCPQP